MVRYVKRRSGNVPVHLWLLIGVMALIEAVLSAADLGWIGNTDWRWMAFEAGAFWQPIFAGQVSAPFPGEVYYMFVTHAFLHGGFGHLAMNAVVLLSLGKLISDRAGPWLMLGVFFLSAIAGGLGFGLLSSATGPMIGASGAAFGFIGLWQYWELQVRQRRGLPVRPVLMTLAGLVLINVVFALMLQGGLAWQAHLGGFVAGFGLGPLVDRMARRRAA